MSKMSRHVHGRQEDALIYWGAMDRARGKTLADFTEREIKDMIWSARLWLRNQPQTEYTEQVLLTQDARAEITRRAMEAEQAADYREGVGV